MKIKNKCGFTLVESVLVILIVLTLTTILVTAINKRLRKEQKYKEKVSIIANFEPSVIGQIYFITATDPEARAVIATPYKFLDDKDGKVKHRVFLSVKNANICERGVWFIISLDGTESVIQSPIAETNTLEKLNE